VLVFFRFYVNMTCSSLRLIHSKERVLWVLLVTLMAALLGSKSSVLLPLWLSSGPKFLARPSSILLVASSSLASPSLLARRPGTGAKATLGWWPR
jgi:hypothetical protein